MLAPPRDPLRERDKREALIREARARQRRRLALTAAGVLVAAGGGFALWAAIPGGGSTAHRGDGGPSAGSSIRQIEAARRRVPIVAMGSSHGVTWAANGLGLWLSANNGRTWLRSVPPHIAATGDPVARIEEVEFEDAIHGWVSASDTFGGPPIPRGAASLRHMEIDRTTNGGRTWHASLPPGCLEACSDASLTFFDARRGYAFVDLSASGGELFSTRDGGAKWTQVARTTWRGSIAFLDWSHAVASNGIVVRETNDGGRHWLPLRPIPRQTFSAVHVFGRQLVVFGLKHRLRLVAYTSGDGGRHWRARVAPAWLQLGPPDNDISTPTARDWVQPAPRQLFVTHDAGRTWHVVRPADLPSGWFISQIDFTSPQVGWAIFALDGQHLFASVLARTTDGGMHWTPAGPRAPKRHRR